MTIIQIIINLLKQISHLHLKYFLLSLIWLALFCLFYIFIIIIISNIYRLYLFPIHIWFTTLVYNINFLLCHSSSLIINYFMNIFSCLCLMNNLVCSASYKFNFWNIFYSLIHLLLINKINSNMSYNIFHS